MTDSPPPPVDVTAALGRDANPANRVYRTLGGRTIKVRTGEVTPSPIFGQRLFLLTGSDCDETGAAYPMGEAGFRIAPPHQVVCRGVFGEPGDLDAMLEAQRVRYVLKVEADAAIYGAPLPAGVVAIPHVDHLAAAPSTDPPAPDAG